jgi:hypothetical protein
VVIGANDGEPDEHADQNEMEEVVIHEMLP